MNGNKLPKDEKRIIILLTLGHIVTDINQGALPAALPFLVLYHDISFAAAGGLMLALTGVSSLIQPLLGYIADKNSNPQIMSIGILIASGGFAALGLVHSYPAMFICAMISGIGILLK
jgi:FSR family fosmidomycin resistance protein-like MFS transporter